MKVYFRLICAILALLILCLGAAACSETKKDSPEITLPEDVYLVSLYSFVSGGISYFDYDTEGRLLSITPVNPSTMQFADDEMGLSVKYGYSDDGKLCKMRFLSYDMELEYSDDGIATGAYYDDGDTTVRIEFEYGEQGRIKKETVYSNGELFLESEYNSIGMLAKETMSMVGDADYIYTQNYTKAEYILSYSEKIIYQIDKGEGGRPDSMTITSPESTQNMLWEYSENGSCKAYTEKTQNSETRYEHSYDSENRLTKTESYYKPLDDEAYLQELIEFSYDKDGNLSSDKYSCFNGDESLWSLKYNEYENKLCTKSVEESYTAGALEKKNVIISEYNDDGLITLSESTVYLGDGAVDRRLVDRIEYNTDKKISKLKSESYGTDNIYNGMFVEEYEYLESGGYKLILSEYDAEGNLKNKSEEIVEE